ncbi:MAG: prolipoprotein diacylglyceryl transferase [Actinomycetota bacterium]|nr:prolipoprotein diacylglyceryl transferase [Actinomycetota bacterium]
MPVVLGAISYDPLVTIDLGPLSISPHGLGIALGFILGARLMLPTTRRQGISDDDVYALLTRAALGAIIGARLAYVANHLSDYESIVEPFQIWKGGISLLGGFFGAILLALPEMRKRRLDFWKVMDAAAPGMALGVVIGRIGDLIVADHLGKPTDFFLGYKCPPLSVETASPCLGEVVHQTALYDLLMTSVLLAALLALRPRPRYPGFLISVFGVWYGVQRVIEDFLREDTRHLGDTLTGSQITAILTILVAGWHLLFVRRTPNWGHWEEPVDDEALDAGDGTRHVPNPYVEAPTMAAPDREEP